jgi:hypothetical protein
MATGGAAAPASRARYDEEPPGYGWVIFAGTMLAIIGVLNFIYGIAAISDSKFYARGVEYVISDLKTWGWVLVVVGVAQVITAFGIWVQAEWARWLGVFSASVNLIIQLIVVSGSPFLSLAVVAIDVLIIYALVAHGGRAGMARG